MTNKPLNFASDLIATANPKLSKKLNKNKNLKEENTQTPTKKISSAQHARFKDEIWRAVSTLNVFRYLTALLLMAMYSMPNINPEWQVLDSSAEHNKILFSAIILLISAIGFSMLAHSQAIDFHLFLLAQFSLDLLLATIIVHITGGIQNTYVLLYFVIVATGSVVLRRKHALALASGAIILLFYEHFYSMLSHSRPSRYASLATIGVALMVTSWVVSNFAQRLRRAELKTFSPGEETIEEFLTREEISALHAALTETNGNKTEAAELLGMTFRSFRYKLTKYGID